MLYLKRPETRDEMIVDHKLIKKVFTEVIIQINSSVLTSIQPDMFFSLKICPTLSVKKNIGLRFFI